MFFSLLVCLLPYWNLTLVGISPVLDEISFWNFLEIFVGCYYTRSKNFQISCMFFSLLVGLLPYCNLTNIGISNVLDEIYFWNFLKHSLDIGSLVFTLLGWAYILTFEFLCAGLNFETPGLDTFWFSGGQLLRPLVLFIWSSIYPYISAT